jgi:undecaprenyl-diphosphatase
MPRRPGKGNRALGKVSRISWWWGWAAVPLAATQARMDSVAFWQAISLGIIEGLTEFLPISSTGHLILAERLLGFTEGGRAFKIVIQLGAILAVCVVFAPKLLGIVRDLPRKPEAQRFTRNILLAFLPAMVLGATLYKQVQALLDNPFVVCAALIAGGVVILLVDRRGKTAHVAAVEDVSWQSSLLIGCAQVLAMVPGTSRSAATIIGAMALGVDRRTAAEFRFPPCSRPPSTACTRNGRCCPGTGWG